MKSVTEGRPREVYVPGPGRWLVAVLAALLLVLAGPHAGLTKAAEAPASQRPSSSGAQQPAQPRDGEQRPPAQTPPAGQPAQQPDPDQPDQETGDDQEQPVFRAGINFVRVDVIVTDRKGAPVDDLRPEDFEVFEDGKRQTVQTFRLIRVSGEVEPGAEAARPIRTDYDEETEAQRDDVRIFVFMLDDYHVRRGAAMAARQQLVRFIRNQLGPLDLIAVMYPLTPVTDLRLTRNHDAVIRAIERFDGRKGDYRPMNELEERYSMYPAEIVERIRNEVSLSALRGLMVRLGGLREGRKAVILVSEGYSNYLPPQLRDPIAEMPGMGNPARGRTGLGDRDPREERAQFFSEAEMQTYLREVYDAANRANTAIYAVDPRGLGVFEYDINQGVGQGIDRQMLNTTMNSLRTLAEETDGRAIINRNDLEGGMRQIVRDSSAYYLIGYDSTQAPTDGKFHEIRVKVNRPGVQVRARKGYWALTAEETARALAPPKPGPDPAITQALASVEGRARAQVVRTWVGTAPAENGRTRVTFVWEAVPPVAGERRDAPAAVSVMAASLDGVPYYRGKVAAGDGPAEAAPGARQGGRVEFEADPGQMQLRLSVEGSGGGAIDSNVLDVSVPDFTAPEVRLSTPEVLRARSALELRALNADPAARPEAGREFRRTDRLLIRFAASAPGAEEPAVEVRLLNRAGNSMYELQPQPVPNGAERQQQVDLPLSGLAPGEYLIEVKSRAGESEAKQLVGFRVVS
jgi:VWFA-related protein